MKSNTDNHVQSTVKPNDKAKTQTKRSDKNDAEEKSRLNQAVSPGVLSHLEVVSPLERPSVTSNGLPTSWLFSQPPLLGSFSTTTCPQHDKELHEHTRRVRLPHYMRHTVSEPLTNNHSTPSTSRVSLVTD
ncbi:hypothetical protein K0M31_007712 [Melipona bicolor]|uniref:Uncharacterized protein n=1 Tax=Melipona bicolor TaxID=60889 RepID=A0AA40GDC9_9HYME|nr:hypothetical protein K0M31_007712 [Melipona bicolor]